VSPISKIDISENTLRNRGCVLDILLIDRTRHKPSRPHNIIWATDSYSKYGKEYTASKQIRREQVTGVNGKLIQPRAAKSKEEQKYRTKDKAEVFTPLRVVKEMNTAINWALGHWPATEENWLDYISEKRLEITCGEAPFIAGRYDPTYNTGVIIRPQNRVGFLDYKLQTVNQFVTTKKDWLVYAEKAIKATYGYEWQGDNLLIARENVLQTLDDFFSAKFGSKNKLSTEQLEYFAEIVAWNIFQMDGIKYVIPMSCKRKHQPVFTVDENQLSLIPSQKPKKQLIECEGCRANNPHKHTGRKVRIMDWKTSKWIYFHKLTNANGLK
jgi:hypothetical protein